MKMDTSLESFMHQEEYALALRDVETKPSYVIEQARKGSLPACMVIRKAAVTNLLPPGILTEVMEMVAELIADSCPPGKVPLLKFALAEVAFAIMSFALHELLPAMDNPPLDPLLKTWPKILEWAKARFIINIHERDRLSQHQHDTRFYLTMFLYGIGLSQHRHEGLRKTAVPDQRVLELAMHLYLSSKYDEFHYINVALGTFNLYIEEHMIRGKDDMTSHFRKALDDIQSAAYGDPETLLKPIFSLMKEADTVEQGTAVVDILHSCNEILGRFIGVRNHPIAVYVAKNGLKAIANGLRLLTDMTPEKHQNSRFADAFGLCICIFSIHSQLPSGEVWMSEALQYPIFRSMAMSSSLLSKAPDERLLRIKELLYYSIPCLLTDPEIIFACENALFAITAEHREHIMNSAFASDWVAFVDRFFDVYVFYCYFEIAGYHKGCYKCGLVASDDKKIVLKRCGACRNAEYCSNDCQTSHWKEHKKDCKGLKNRKYGPLPRWAIPLFQRRLASHDARRHLPGIRTIAAQKFPCFPLQCVCTKILYDTYPPRVSVTLANENNIPYDQLTKEAANLLFNDLCFDDVRLHDGSSGILEIVDIKNANPDFDRHFQHFLWAPPYFSSVYGSMCSDMRTRRSVVPPYLDEEGHALERTWSVVDEITYRGDLNPQMISDGKLSEIRRKVLEVIVREKARMRSGPC